MAGGCADHRRGRSARGGLADVRPLPDLGPGGPPVAVRRVSATSGHARRRPNRVSARAREKSDTSLAAPSPVVPFVGSSPWACRRH